MLHKSLGILADSLLPRSQGITGSDITLFQASPTHVNFEVSTIPSWVVEEWNGLESSHPRFPCLENLGFLKNFQIKT